MYDRTWYTNGGQDEYNQMGGDISFFAVGLVCHRIIKNTNSRCCRQTNQQCTQCHQQKRLLAIPPSTPHTFHSSWYQGQPIEASPTTTTIGSVGPLYENAPLGVETVVFCSCESVRLAKWVLANQRRYFCLCVTSYQP